MYVTDGFIIDVEGVPLSKYSSNPLAHPTSCIAIIFF